MNLFILPSCTKTQSKKEIVHYSSWEQKMMQSKSWTYCKRYATAPYMLHEELLGNWHYVQIGNSLSFRYDVWEWIRVSKKATKVQRWSFEKDEWVDDTLK